MVLLGCISQSDAGNSSECPSDLGAWVQHTSMSLLHAPPVTSGRLCPRTVLTSPDCFLWQHPHLRHEPALCGQHPRRRDRGESYGWLHGQAEELVHHHHPHPIGQAQDLAPTKLQGKLRYRFLHGQEEGDGAGAPSQHACTPWSAGHYRELTVDFMKANTQIIQRLCYGFMVSLLPGTGFCFAKTKAKCGLSMHVYVCVRK